MKIKKLELMNFRQFIGEHVLEFSTNEDKNVTFIMAENTSGKTTIIEAFRFLFTGATNLGEEGIINIDLNKNTLPGNDLEIKVVVEIEYKGIDYTITRKNVYKKHEKKLTQTINTLIINFKDENGVTKKFMEASAKDFLKEIMPENLFSYFFFEGEEIEKLGANLFAKNKKQSAFAEAIKNLLGFTYLYRMRDDLLRVDKKINDDLKDAYDSDNENKAIQEDINKHYDDKVKCEEEVKVKIEELESLKEQKDKVNKILLENSGTKQKQNERAVAKQKLELLDKKIKQTKQKLFSDFSKNGWFLFASKLKDRAIETLKSEGQIDKGIPGLDAECIKFIIEHKKCICGAEIVEGTKAYEKLIELENFIPPKSIGSQIREFKNKTNDIAKSSNLAIDSVTRQKKELNESIAEYEKIEKNIDELDKILSDSKDMSDYVEQQKQLEEDIGKFNIEIGSLNERINNDENRIKELEKSKKGVKTNERAKFKEKCLYYNRRCYNAVDKYITNHENDMKTELESKINEVFKNVFEVGYVIKLNDDLCLEMELDSENIANAAKLSGAQDTIIAFAFIGAIIELAKKQIEKTKNKNVKDDNSDETEFEDNAEPYPLVLDAPSSNLDIKRIKEFCNFIPTLSEQTIILIKDTDGKYVESELVSRIGKRYKLNKVNVWKTTIEES